MAHGGARNGSGRKAGAATVKTREVADRAAAEGLTPLDYLLSIVRDDLKDEAKRIDCAKAAAPYVHARLSNVDANVKGDLRHEFTWLV